MAMQQLTLPGQIVKKHNELIRSKINVNSQTAGKILACLVACVRQEDTQFKNSYSLNIKDFLSDVGAQKKYIRDACKELATATVETEWPDPEDPDDFIFYVMPFFSSIKYRKGIVEAKFNPEMSNFLLKLKACFTQYNLLDYLKLPSSYSQRFFELLMSWRFQAEVILSIADLHKILDVPDSFRTDFRQFRIYVLEKAQKDIHKHTTLRFEWETVKRGRAVEAIRFIFGVKRSLPVAKKKANDAIEKQAQINNTNFLAAIACFKERGAACEGNHQKPVICELCLKIR